MFMSKNNNFPSLENVPWYFHGISFRYADQLTVGDEVLVQEDNELIPVQVTNISSMTMQGNYFS